MRLNPLPAIAARFSASDSPTLAGTRPSRAATRDQQQHVARISSIGTFEAACAYQLTKIVRSHIVGLTSCLPLRYVNAEGKPGSRSEVHGVLETLQPHEIGAFAADIKMLGNGLLVKVQEPLASGRLGQTTALEYLPAQTTSPIIPILGTPRRYALTGWAARTPSEAIGYPYGNYIPRGVLDAYGADPYLPVRVTSIARPLRSGAGAGGMRYSVEQVIHARQGVDAHYPRQLGENLLAYAMPILDYDAKQNDHTLSVLEKLATLGVLVTVETDPLEIGGEQEVEEFIASEAQRIREQTVSAPGGMVFTKAGVSVSEFSAPVARFRFDDLYQSPEFRFSAMFDAPAATLGLQAGMENSPWSNLPTLRKYEFDELIAPLADTIGQVLTGALLREFDSAKGERIELDTASLPIVQEDENTKAQRLGMLVDKQIITTDEARVMLGLEPRGEGNDGNAGDD